MEIKTNNGLFKINFESETVEDKLFLELIQRVVHVKLNESAQAINNAAISKAEEYADKIYGMNDVSVIRNINTSVPPGYDEIVSSRIESAINDASVKKIMDRSSSPFAQSDKKLVVGKCECGNGYGIWLDNETLKKRNFVFICKECEEKHIIVADELVPATYNCPNCRRKSSFWVKKEECSHVQCKNCESEIDLFYNEKKQMMMN